MDGSNPGYDKSDDQGGFSSSASDDWEVYHERYDGLEKESPSHMLKDLRRQLRDLRRKRSTSQRARSPALYYGQTPLESQGQPGPYWGYGSAPGAYRPPPPNPDSQRPLHHSNNPQASYPAQAQAFWEPPVRQQQSNFWNQWEQFKSEVEQQAGRSLVSARKPWNPQTGGAYPQPGNLEAPGSQPAGYFFPRDRSGLFAPNNDKGAVQEGGGHFLRPEANPGAAKGVERPSAVGDGFSDDVTFQHAFARRSSERKVQGGLQGIETAEGFDSASRIPDAEITSARVDLIHDPTQASKDMSIRLELEIEEDWEDDLEEFCRLKRLGLIKEAREHFRSTLEHLSTIPYIRVQYAEMLQSAGDYKGFQSLVFLPEFPPGPSDETSDDRSRGKLVANHALLDLLSQRPIPKYLTAAWSVVRNTLSALAADTTVGSTEIQLLSLCLRVLKYLKSCTHESIVGPVNVYAKCLFNWRQLYHDLVGEGCIWDFRDLFMAAVLAFGWQDALVQFFGTTHLPRAMDIIIKDWNRPFYDEASVMGLLDLFTSLILDDHSDGMKTRNLLLLHHARAFAESAEHNDPELMRTRPFVQWLLAKSVLELEPPPERPDGVRLEHFSGLELNQGGGIHLPIYVPSRHTRKPDWDMFFSRSTPAQRRVVEVAVRAAEQIGDYNLQAESMRLLILQSRDPKPWMSALADLQLEIQGDKEGYLSTCLSRYLVTSDPAEEATLLRNLEKPSGVGKALYFEQCENASLTWAWSMVRILLTSANDDNGSVATDGGESSPFLNRGFSLDGSKLPPYVAEFASIELGIPVSKSMEALSLDDLKPPRVDAGEHAQEGQTPDPALRNRLARGTARREDGLEETNPWNPSAFETWGWMPNYNGVVQPPGPPLPPPYLDRQEHVPAETPWPYYSGQQLDPLAQGIDPTLEVNGWPSTWFEDAKRHARGIQQGPEATDQHRFSARGKETSPGTAHVQQGAGNSKEGQDRSREKGQKSASGNQKESGIGQDRARPARQDSNKDQKKAKAKTDLRNKSIPEELESCDGGSDRPETEKDPRDDAKERPHISVENGVTQLNFPGNVLDVNGMTVLLTNRKDPSKLKAFIVKKGGVFETIASGRSHRRRDDAASADQNKSEFKVRTTSVSFDVASLSSESTVKQQRNNSKIEGTGKGTEPSKPPDAEAKNEAKNETQEPGEKNNNSTSPTQPQPQSKPKDPAQPSQLTQPPQPPQPPSVRETEPEDSWGFFASRHKKKKKAGSFGAPFEDEWAAFDTYKTRKPKNQEVNESRQHQVPDDGSVDLRDLASTGLSKKEEEKKDEGIDKPLPSPAREVDTEDPWNAWVFGTSKSHKKKKKKAMANDNPGESPSQPPPISDDDVDVDDLWDFSTSKSRKKKDDDVATPPQPPPVPDDEEDLWGFVTAKSRKKAKKKAKEATAAEVGAAAAAAAAVSEATMGAADIDGGTQHRSEVVQGGGKPASASKGDGSDLDGPALKDEDLLSAPPGQTAKGKADDAGNEAGETEGGAKVGDAQVDDGRPPRAPSPPPTDTPGLARPPGIEGESAKQPVLFRFGGLSG